MGEADFCVNGFAFWPDIEKTSDGYYAALQRGPEVIENMERFLGNNMLDEYRRKTNYYGIVFKVPLSEIVSIGRFQPFFIGRNQPIIIG